MPCSVEIKLMDRVYKTATPASRADDGLVLHHWVKKGSVEDENGLDTGKAHLIGRDILFRSV
jgi:hypothetical protein